jgi:hypothetical protein
MVWVEMIETMVFAVNDFDVLLVDPRGAFRASSTDQDGQG